MKSKPLPTYENDKDLSELIYTEVTDEKVLNFFFKKGGIVNVNNLQYCVGLYGKKELAQHIVNLETAGMIKAISSFEFKLTTKARFDRIYSSKSIVFWLILIGTLATLLTLIIA